MSRSAANFPAITAICARATALSRISGKRRRNRHKIPPGLLKAGEKEIRIGINYARG
jgi:hypothetical protein